MRVEAKAVRYIENNGREVLWNWKTHIYVKCEETTNKTRRKIMSKKIMMMVLTTILTGVMLTGCYNPFQEDDVHATVSITTSDGRANVFQSVNGSNSMNSGRGLALGLGHKHILKLKNGEMAHIVFQCDACGNRQEFDIDEAWADVISCHCPEKMDNDGNAREYVAVEVTYNQDK